MKINGFITNLGKYNEGQLIGEWITFPITDEDLAEVLERIGINEQYEEYFFTDWDSELDVYPILGEYPSIEYVNDLAEQIEDFGDDELLTAAAELWELSEVLANGQYDYYLHRGINNDEDLGYYWIEESGCYNTESLGALANYIDYESFGRDVRLESNGGFTDYGYIEYVG